MIAWRLVKERNTDRNLVKGEGEQKGKKKVKVQKSWIQLALENTAFSETRRTKVGTLL